MGIELNIKYYDDAGNPTNNSLNIVVNPGGNDTIYTSATMVDEDGTIEQSIVVSKQSTSITEIAWATILNEICRSFEDARDVLVEHSLIKSEPTDD